MSPIAPAPANCLRLARLAMGTRFEIAFPRRGPHGGKKRELLEAALDEVGWFDRRLSAFRRDSLLSHVNRNAAAGPVRVDPDLFELLELCRAVYAASGGAFDVSVGPLMQCWGFRGGSGRTPAPGDLARARAAVGFDAVVLDAAQRAIRFTRPLALDLGGVAKGFALDRAAAVLREEGVESALLHGGTSTVAVIGGGPGATGDDCAAPAAAPGSPWRIGVRSPQDGGITAVAHLRDAALAVSGPHGRCFEENGRRRGHLIDPRTGAPAEGALLAAVAADSAAAADAWSTALLVAGPERFDELAHRAEGVQAALIVPAAPAAAAPIVRGRHPEIFKTCKT